MGLGIKFWKFHMLPWCFHHIQCLEFQSDPPVETIKLIKYDGLVKIYHQPISVSNLLVEFPNHLVCGSDSFYIGQKIPALSQDYRLQLGRNYFLLPKHFFQSVLSFVTIASLSRDAAFVNKAATVQPFDLQKTSSGCLRIRVSEEFISQLKIESQQGKIKEEEEDDDDKHRSRLCTTAQLQKDYTKLVGSQQWKPKLETIREKEKRKISSFGIKSKKKSLLKFNRNHHHVSSSSTNKPPSKPKLKSSKHSTL